MYLNRIIQSYRLGVEGGIKKKKQVATCVEHILNSCIYKGGLGATAGNETAESLLLNKKASDSSGLSAPAMGL